MKEVITHPMQYYGGKIDCNLAVVNYKYIYHEEYKAIYNNCFRPMQMAIL